MHVLRKAVAAVGGAPNCAVTIIQSSRTFKSGSDTGDPSSAPYSYVTFNTSSYGENERGATTNIIGE